MTDGHSASTDVATISGGPVGRKIMRQKSIGLDKKKNFAFDINFFYFLSYSTVDIIFFL
jgi:hypothetical protein